MEGVIRGKLPTLIDIFAVLAMNFPAEDSDLTKGKGKEENSDTGLDDQQDSLENSKTEKMFTLKKWNAVAMWSWDVECDTCAICRVQVMDACLRCQSESSQGRSQDCVVVWGECNHSFHYCCMSLWVKQNNRCPLCQQEWSIQRMGK